MNKIALLHVKPDRRVEILLLSPVCIGFVLMSINEVDIRQNYANAQEELKNRII